MNMMSKKVVTYIYNNQWWLTHFLCESWHRCWSNLKYWRAPTPSPTTLLEENNRQNMTKGYLQQVCLLLPSLKDFTINVCVHGQIY